MVSTITSFKSPSFFIFSSGRSGTTLLASMLNSSQQVCIPYESDFVARGYPFLQGRNHFSESDYLKVAKLFQATAQENGWGMSLNYIQEYLCFRKPQNFQEILATICEAYHTQEGTQELMWGIKAPVLIASIERILTVCPQAKLVHIVRDGRDVCVSYKRIHEKSIVRFGPKGVIANALYWVDGLRRIEDCKSTHIYELRYESLLDKPQDVLKDLCEYLGIQYMPAMHQDFQSEKRNQKLAPREIMQSIHTKIQGGLDSQNTRKYLTRMSKGEIFLFELFAIPYLVKYDYQPVFSFLNLSVFHFIRWPAYRFARIFNNLRYYLRDHRMQQQASQNKQSGSLA